jgi:hypothetical protein|tara:strand:+ start:272 stop:409 length:138 start_codon:yes stop_codon:yes gene_type:complete
MEKKIKSKVSALELENKKLKKSLAYEKARRNRAETDLYIQRRRDR